MILGTAPVEGRLSGVVDIQLASLTIYIPARSSTSTRQAVGEGTPA